MQILARYGQFCLGVVAFFLRSQLFSDRQSLASTKISLARCPGMKSDSMLPQKIAQRLDEGLSLLSPEISPRLALARALALQQMPPARGGFSGIALSGLLQGMAFRKAAWGAALSAVLLVAAGSQYSNIQHSADQAALIDEEILSGSAPVQAYMDPDFALAFRSEEAWAGKAARR